VGGRRWAWWAPSALSATRDPSRDSGLASAPPPCSPRSLTTQYAEDALEDGEPSSEEEEEGEGEEEEEGAGAAAGAAAAAGAPLVLPAIPGDKLRKPDALTPDVFQGIVSCRACGPLRWPLRRFCFLGSTSTGGGPPVPAMAVVCASCC
jgi:hypothetical protein